MEKKINIGKVELQIKSSLFTIIAYKNQFGTDLFADVQSLNVTKENMDISNLVRVLFQIVFILNKPYNNSISFDDFLNQFDMDILSDVDQLTGIMNIIGEMLGSVKKKGASVPTPR